MQFMQKMVNHSWNLCGQNTLKKRIPPVGYPSIIHHVKVIQEIRDGRLSLIQSDDFIQVENLSEWVAQRI